MNARRYRSLLASLSLACLVVGGCASPAPEPSQAAREGGAPTGPVLPPCPGPDARSDAAVPLDLVVHDPVGAAAVEGARRWFRDRGLAITIRPGAPVPPIPPLSADGSGVASILAGLPGDASVHVIVSPALAPRDSGLGMDLLALTLSPLAPDRRLAEAWGLPAQHPPAIFLGADVLDGLLADERPLLVAHELGHALGLPHSAGDDLMRAGRRGCRAGLDAQQIERVQAGANTLRAR